MRTALVSALIVSALASTTALASPAVMVQPKDAVIIVGGVGSGSIVDTYNQAGLAAGYIDEVTPVHHYAPTLHTLVFAGNEWFGDSGTTDATVSYYVSAVKPNYINHMILWNEESSGLGVFDLWYGATAGALTTQLLFAEIPPDNPLADYAGTIYHFDPSPKVGWYTIVASRCPQPDPGSYPACAIGEVAFGGPVPEPASWALMIAGFGLIGTALRRRQSVVTA